MVENIGSLVGKVTRHFFRYMAPENIVVVPSCSKKMETSKVWAWSKSVNPQWNLPVNFTHRLFSGWYLFAYVTDSLDITLDSVEYLSDNGSFAFASFTLPSPVREHCVEPMSNSVALIYGGRDTRDVYLIDFINGGLVTPKSPLLVAGMLREQASCGGYVEQGVKHVIYAGGSDNKWVTNIKTMLYEYRPVRPWQMKEITRIHSSHSKKKSCSSLENSWWFVIKLQIIFLAVTLTGMEYVWWVTDNWKCCTWNDI